MMDLTNRIALLQQAESADNEGHQKEALGILSRCLDLYPGFSPARVLRGEIFARMGELEKSAAELDAIIRSNPENIRARILLTRVLCEAGRREDAETHLEFLGFMMPESDPALEELRLLIEESSRRESSTVQAIDDPTLIEENAVEGASNPTIGDFSDTVTEVIDTQELLASEASLRSPESPASQGDANQPDEVVELLEEAVPEEQVVTAHLPEKESGTQGDDVEAGVDIKTRTMAQVYERQGMFQDALDVLVSLRQKHEDSALDSEIARLKGLVKGTVQQPEVTSSPGTSRKVIRALENWLEKIHAVS